MIIALLEGSHHFLTKLFSGKLIFSLVLRILSFFVLKNRKLILFGMRSDNHFDDNSGALYQYFTKYHKEEFRCVWLTNGIEALSYVENMGGEAYLRRSLIGIWLSLRAGLIVITHNIEDVLVYKPILKKTKVLYLHHGIPVRKGHLESKSSVTKGDLKFIGHRKYITYMVATSQWGSDRQRSIIPVMPSQVQVTGYPRNDVLFQPDSFMINSIRSKYNLGDYTVLYASTWRKWDHVRYFPFKDLDMRDLCSFLKERKITIIIRPHPSDLKRQRDSSFWKNLNNLNKVVRIIAHNEPVDVQLLLSLSNCLITDYSSIYHDYLLLNKPIIFLPYDIDEYSQKTGGFNVDYNEFTPGPKPKTQKEFLGYLEMFYKKEDPYSERRFKIRNIVHKYKDGQSCRRVYELIKEMTGPV